MDNSCITQILFSNFGLQSTQKRVLKNVQFGNRVQLRENRLWVSYPEELVGLSNGQFGFIGQ